MRRMINPLQINNLGIKNFLKIILAVQLALLGVIGLNAIGLDIPILRQLIGFIYLTFVPGIIILRIIKLHKLGNIETLLYTVGLSIATLMFTGLFMNSLYPFFGISTPISITPLTITISVVVLVLCIISYIRDRDFSDLRYINIKDVLSPPTLFLYLIPFLAVFGTYLVNFHKNNIILIFLIIIIAIIALLIGFDKFIPKNLYPLAVFVIAISLLYHNSLISMYLWGWDINYEFYICNLVRTNAIWNPLIHGNCNAMLSLVMLNPIYSIILNMNITWIFKIIYPLLFSLVPLGLYRVYQKYTDDGIAFLSCFFFVSLFQFYTGMLALARQEIAELFLVLLLLAMIDKDMDKIKRSFLLIVFGISLVTSHYGLSYIYMFLFVTVWIILVLMENLAIQRISKYKNKISICNTFSLFTENRAISSTFVLIFIVFALAWYMYVSGSSAFNALVSYSDHVVSNIFTDFTNPEAARGLGMIEKEVRSQLHSVNKYLHLIVLFFISVGILKLLLKHRDIKFEREYAVFSLENFAIALFAIVAPNFIAYFKPARLYHVTLIFLAPFCVIGGITVFNMVSKVSRLFLMREHVKSASRMLSIFLVIFLLFNSGFVYEIAKDRPTSISLSMKSMEENTQDLGYQIIDVEYIYEYDFFSAIWLSKKGDDNAKIYAGHITNDHVLNSYGMQPSYRKRPLLYRAKPLWAPSYIYLRYLNVVRGVIVFKDPETRSKSIIGNSTDISPPIKKMSKIYANGGSEIYYYE